MATYTELRDLFSDSALQNRVEVALVIAANNLISSTPTANDKAWAANVFSNPKLEARKALMAVLAENSAATVAQIQGATDATLQSNVNGVVGVLVDAQAGA